MSGTSSIKGRTGDWGLYRYFLAVAKTGSLTGAAQRLGVSQPTVGRQIQALEEAMGARLFDRGTSGYVLTSAGDSIYSLAQVIEEQTHAIERRVAGEDSRLEGRVRISAAEGLATFWLAPRAAGTQAALSRRRDRAHRRLRASLDMMRREADIVLRIGEPRSDDLIGRRIGKVHFGLFAAESYLAEHGTPESLDQLSGTTPHRVGRRDRRPGPGQACEQPGGRGAGRDPLQQSGDPVRRRAGPAWASWPCRSTSPRPRRNCAGVLAKDFDVALDLWLLVHRDLQAHGPHRRGLRVPRRRALPGPGPLLKGSLTEFELSHP